MKIEFNQKLLVAIATFICALFFTHFSLAKENPEFVVPAPGESIIVGTLDSLPDIARKGKATTYESQLDQNSIENQYKVFFQQEGFNYRKDKEVRKDAARRLRFDREELVIDIILIQRETDTKVLVMQYLATDAFLDIKDIADIDFSKIELPKYDNQDKFKPEPFYAQPGEINVYPEQGLNFDIPPVPNSKILEGEIPEALTGSDGQGQVYLSQSSPEQAVSFYQNFLRGQGFKLKPDKGFNVANVRRLRFERKDLTVDIYLSRRDNGCNITVIKYPGSGGGAPVEKNPFTGFSLPKEDNPGSDLEEIPRPEQSVRSQSTTNGKETNLSYFVPGSVVEIKNFYLKQMVVSGWQLTSQVNIGKASNDYAQQNKGQGFIPSLPVADAFDLGEIIKNSYSLDFKTSVASARIMIYPNFIDQKAGVMVDILYIKN